MLTVPATSVGDITISAVTQQIETERIHYTGVYPQISGIRDPEGQKRLNVEMKEWEQASLSRAKAAVLTLPTGDGPERVVEGVYGYVVKRNGGGLASILFSDYLYAGGANGLDVKNGCTFSTATGQIYTLRELFRNQDSYMSIIDKEIRKQLRERDLESKLLVRYPGIDNQTAFYLTDTELVIVARELEWFPHAMGTVEFPISLNDLRPYLCDFVTAVP